MIEVMAAAVLYGACSLLATAMFVTTVHVSRDAPRAMAAEVKIDALRTQMTRDVLNASSMTTPNAQTLVVGLPLGGHITWEYGDGKVTRTVTPISVASASEAPREYRGLAPMRFAVQGSIATCAIEAPAAPVEAATVRSSRSVDSILPPGRSATFTFQSQLMLEGRP